MTITRTAKYSKKLNIIVGDLKHLIKIQKRTLKPPTNIDFIETYEDVTEVWASVKINNGEFTFSKTNIEEDITHIFYIRYLDNITLDNWILYDNRRYKIVSINDIDFEKKFLEIRCNIKGDISEESSKW